MIVSACVAYALFPSWRGVSWGLCGLIVIVAIGIFVLLSSLGDLRDSKHDNWKEPLTYAQEKEIWEKNQQGQIHNVNFPQTGETYEQHLAKEKQGKEEYTHYPE
jgi:ABC-type nickel/cobalt efflux system permease component RcnA